MGLGWQGGVDAGGWLQAPPLNGVRGAIEVGASHGEDPQEVGGVDWGPN